MKKTMLAVAMMLGTGLTLTAQTQIQDGTHRNYEVVTTRDAAYPGGNEAMYRSFMQRMKYPAEAMQQRITGDVMVSFFVEADSTTSEVRALRNPGGGLKEEAERIIKETKFAPAIQNGKPVRQQMMIPVLFRIYD